MNFLLKLENLDRRWIFLCVAASVVLPMIFNFSIPIYPSKSVEGLYNFLEKMPEGERAYLSFDYDPASEPELGPCATAIILHMFQRGQKPLCGGNWPLAKEMAAEAISRAKELYETHYETFKKADKLAPCCKPKLIDGQDYVNLGYKPGGIILVKAMVADFMSSFPTDSYDKPTGSMPVFKNPDGRKFEMSDVGIIISFTAGTNGIEAFINVAGDHKRPMAAGCTSVNIPRFVTYLQTGQMVGMTAGLPGAAEYESLLSNVREQDGKLTPIKDSKGKALNLEGKGIKGMTPQSIAHLVIMIFIIVGNLAYIAEKRTAKKKA